VDEGDEAYQEERAPTWNGRDVAVERARRAGVPCVLTSPCPSLEALRYGPLAVPSRSEERTGWPVLEVVDRRKEPPGAGLFSSRLVALAREAEADARVVCVLNRKGRARLLACATCRELARCEACGAAVEGSLNGLRCRRCGTERPTVCLACGATRLATLRVGVSRAREELELLANRPVAEVTADTAAGPLPPGAPVLVGTEAVLHRVTGAASVAFLDFDQELLAPRYRAAEAALGLLARAARLIGGRQGRGRILVQTRVPGHEVIDAALHADPSRLAVVEAARRAALRFPPEAAVAAVSGQAAAAFVEAIGDRLDVLGPANDRWLLRAPDHEALCDTLAATPRPSGRLRIEVDPLRA
jgi:primosomal protein N' (replication factor Y)